MGYIILDERTSVWVHDFKGTCRLTTLLNDIMCPEYTMAYRLYCARAAAECVGKPKILSMLHTMECLDVEKRMVAQEMAEMSANFAGVVQSEER